MPAASALPPATLVGRLRAAGASMSLPNQATRGLRGGGHSVGTRLGAAAVGGSKADRPRGRRRGRYKRVGSRDVEPAWPGLGLRGGSRGRWRRPNINGDVRHPASAARISRRLEWDRSRRNRCPRGAWSQIGLAGREAVCGRLGDVAVADNADNVSRAPIDDLPDAILGIELASNLTSTRAVNETDGGPAGGGVALRRLRDNKIGLDQSASRPRAGSA